MFYVQRQDGFWREKLAHAMQHVSKPIHERIPGAGQIRHADDKARW